MLKPGKWYGVKFTEKRIVPSLQASKKYLGGLTHSFVPEIRPLGMYVGPQWVCQSKSSYPSTAFLPFLPEKNERPNNPGPTWYFEFHAFLMADNRFMWVNHEDIDRLEELDEQSYLERIGCGNHECKFMSISTTVSACGTDLVNDNEIVNPCLTCAKLLRKALKARGWTHIHVFPEHPLETSDSLSGL
jgi:hypothetical protein